MSNRMGRARLRVPILEMLHIFDEQPPLGRVAHRALGQQGRKSCRTMASSGYGRHQTFVSIRHSPLVAVATVSFNRAERFWHVRGKQAYPARFDQRFRMADERGFEASSGATNSVTARSQRHSVIGEKALEFGKISRGHFRFQLCDGSVGKPATSDPFAMTGVPVLYIACSRADFSAPHAAHNPCQFARSQNSLELPRWGMMWSTWVAGSSRPARRQ
jgi:hypothetical protein